MLLLNCVVCNASCQSCGFDNEPRHAGISAVRWHDSVHQQAAGEWLILAEKTTFETTPKCVDDCLFFLYKNTAFVLVPRARVTSLQHGGLVV